MGFGALMMLIYITLYPSVSQGFYWFSAYTAFTLPSLLYFWLLCLLVRKGPCSFVLSCVLALLIPGGNEVIAVITVCTLLYLFLIYRERRYGVLLFFSCVATFIVVLSPGNGVRMAQQLSLHPYLWSLLLSVSQTVSWLFLWLPILLVATLLYVPLVGRKLSTSAVFNVSLFKFIIAFLVTVVLAHVPPTLGLSSVMIDRTANCLLMFFIPAYFYGVTLLLHKYPHVATSIDALFSNRFISAATYFCFLFIGPFAIEQPVVTAMVDLVTGKAMDYAAIQQKRIHMAQNGAAGESLQLPSFGITPKSLFVKDLGSSPDDEFNQDFCSIYGAKSGVFVRDTDITFEDNWSSIKNYGKAKRGM
jgi:hypothetical protein